MKIHEDQIREIAIKAVNELGSSATPDSVKAYVQKEIEKFGEPLSKDTDSGRVILTSFGLNRPGVVSNITTALSEFDIDILDISQKIMQEFFTMIMMIDISSSKYTLKDVQDKMNELSTKMNVKIFIQHEDVFRYMHRI